MSTQSCGCDEEAGWQCKYHYPTIPAVGKMRPGAVQSGSGHEVFGAVNAGQGGGGCGTAKPVDSADVAIALRREFPHGHPSFLPITLRELKLHSEKNHDYAKGGDPLGNFTRFSTILGLYPNLKLADQKVVALIYALKQLDAVLWGLNSNIEHKVEGLASRLQDISVYAKIVQCMVEDKS